MPRESELEALLAEARDELYEAKSLVRTLRNRTKVIAAALHDRETAIDRLIGRLETFRNPTPEEAQDHGNEVRTHEEAAVR